MKNPNVPMNKLSNCLLPFKDGCTERKRLCSLVQETVLLKITVRFLKLMIQINGMNYIDHILVELNIRSELIYSTLSQLTTKEYFSQIDLQLFYL